MTAPRRDGRPTTSFSAWVQSNPRLDSIRAGMAIMDIDWIIHCYRAPCDRVGKRTVNHLMLIEEKSYLADLTDCQRDTMYFIDRALMLADKRRLKSAFRGDIVAFRYWGYHKLRYAGGDIAVSPTIYWDKTVIDLGILERVLRFELNPRTLLERSDRRHHAPPQLPLLD